VTGRGELLSLHESLAETVTRAVREVAFFDEPRPPAYPPPQDLEAERIVLVNVLETSSVPGDFLPLTSADFFDGRMGFLFECAEIHVQRYGSLNRSRLELALALKYRIDDGIARRLVERVILETPSVPFPFEQARRIHDLARLRGLLRELARLDAGARVGALPPALVADDLEVALATYKEGLARAATPTG
jgi:hypothetical protein